VNVNKDNFDTYAHTQKFAIPKTSPDSGVVSPPHFQDVNRKSGPFIKNAMRFEETQNLSDDIKLFDYHNDNRIDKSNADSSSAAGPKSFKQPGINLASAPITPNTNGR
jgi:hypothetical protein